MGLLPKGVTLSGILALVFLAYITNSMYTMYKIYNPADCVPSASEVCLQPAWKHKGDLKHQVNLETSPRLYPHYQLESTVRG